MIVFNNKTGPNRHEGYLWCRTQCRAKKVNIVHEISEDNAETNNSLNALATPVVMSATVISRVGDNEVCNPHSEQREGSL